MGNDCGDDEEDDNSDVEEADDDEVDERAEAEEDKDEGGRSEPRRIPRTRGSISAKSASSAGPAIRNATPLP